MIAVCRERYSLFLTEYCYYCKFVVNNQLAAQLFFSYTFIPILYMFRAPLCSSSGESIVLIRRLAYVTVFRWPFYAFFWVIPWRLNFISRHFGKLCLFHLHRLIGVVILYLPAYKDGTVFRNVGIYNSDARELPRRKHTTFRIRQKFEIKYM
jgi:hypothetical protein